MTKSVNQIISEVVMATKAKLLNDPLFLELFDEYPFAQNVRVANNGEINLHFYPTTIDEIKRQFSMLTMKTGSQFKFKFPSILLILDTPIEFGGENPKAVIDIAILTQSNAEWPSFDKDYKVFRTVLRPIADVFLKQLAKSKHISRPYAGFKYTYVERFNTSADLVKQSVQLYGSSVDAIELIQMQLDLLNLEC